MLTGPQAQEDPRADQRHLRTESDKDPYGGIETSTNGLHNRD